MKGFGRNPLRQVKQRAIAAVLLLTMAPVILATGAMAIDEIILPFLPYLVAFLLLWWFYRLLLGRRR